MLVWEGGHFATMLASQRTYLGTHLKVFENYFESLEKVFENMLNDFVVFCLLFQRVKNIEIYNHVWEMKHAPLHGKQVYVYSHLKLKSN